MLQPDPRRARQRPHGGAVRAAQGPAADWIRDHLDAVYRYVRRRLSHADAEDIAQQAFEALFRAEAQGRGARDPAAYLLGVARRRVADAMRRRARRPQPVALPEGWEGYGREALPLEVLERVELRELVHVALGLLRGDEARLLQDRYRREASVAAIAEREGLTPKAVEMRLRRARAAFLARFHEVGHDWVDAGRGRRSDERKGEA